ncbi:MAG: Mov34/MPN/PAD-1 family protein [Phycisphaerae bacterium]
MALQIAHDDTEALRRFAYEALPNECCGLLLGRRSDGRVERVEPADNITEGDARRSYQIDWKTLLRASREAHRGGREIVGFYHSHPDGSTRPSRQDAVSAWVDHVYVIIGLTAETAPRLSAWRIPPGSSAGASPSRTANGSAGAPASPRDERSRGRADRRGAVAAFEPVTIHAR